MINSIVTAPSVALKSLDNLFIELTAKNCNLKCKHCYIAFEPYKKIKDFISIDLIRDTLDRVAIDEIKYIYLTGAEPMLHPDFNAILRLCLRKSNVTIHTNGMTINDKKARFLRKVDDETNHEIVFRVSLDHFDEIKNDNIRGRGSYRKVVYGIQCLVKYGFRPVVTVVNYDNMSKDAIMEGFAAVFKRFNFEIEPMNIHVTPYIDKLAPVDIDANFKDKGQLDCATGRILTAKGLYNCPLLAQDSRGKSGSNIGDYSKKSYLDTSICAQCAEFGGKMFTNSWV